MNLSVSGNVDDPETRVPLSSSGNKRPRVDEDQQDDSENEDTEERTDLDRFGFPRGVCQRVKVTAVNYSGVDLSLESPSVKGNGVKPCPRTSVESFRDWRFRYRYQTGRGPSKAESYVKKDVCKTNVRDKCTGGVKAKADFAQHDDVVGPILTELEYWLGPNIKGGWKQARFKFVDWQGTPWTDELERSNCCKFILRKACSATLYVCSAFQSLQAEVLSLRQATSNMRHLQCSVPGCMPSTFFFSNVSNLNKHNRQTHQGGPKE